MRRPRRLVTATVAAAAVGTGLASAPAAPAAAADGDSSVVRTDREVDQYFYGDFAELLAYAVAPITAETCPGGDGFPTVTVISHEEQDGTWTERWRDRLPLTLYRVEAGLEAPQFLEEQCAAIAAGAEAPEPFATGDGLVRSLVSDAVAPGDGGGPQPGSHLVNSVRGIVTDVDGQRWLVHATADLELTETGPVGDPQDFVTFSIRPLGG